MAARFWVGGTGTWDNASTANWSATTGGASGASAPTFDGNSGTGTCTTAAGSASSTLTLNTQNIALVFGANHTASAALTLTQGSINLAGFVLNCTTVSSSNANTRSIAFGSTGQINLTATSGTLWTTSASTGFTTSGTNKVVTAPNGGAGTRTFNPGSSLAEINVMTFKVTSGSDTVSLQGRYFNIDLTGFTGSIANNGRVIYGSLTLQSGLTFAGSTSFSATSGSHVITTAGVTLNASFTFNNSGGIWSFADAANFGTGNLIFTAGTLRLKAGETTTVTAFSTSGSAELHYLESTTSGSQATLSQASGTVTASFLSIKDINATGGATWNAFVDQSNIDAGNNDGWNFGISPVIGGSEYTYQLRSFTQPRRF
jgi:hypothetical protein